MIVLNYSLYNNIFGIENNISNIGFKCFVQNLHYVTKLKTIKFWNNYIDDDGVIYFAHFLHLLPSLETVDLKGII